MVHLDGMNSIIANRDGVGGGYGLITHNRMFRCRDGGKIGPDFIVEHVFLEIGKHIGPAEDGHLAGFGHQGQIVDEKRNSLDVVQVRMGQEDMGDSALLVSVQAQGNGSGIHQKEVVDEKSRGITAGTLGAGRAEYVHFPRGKILCSL